MFFSLLIFAGGAMLGTVAHFCVQRIKDASTRWGHAPCHTCRTRVSLRHRVPIFFWLSHLGRCPACGRKVHASLPLLELACGGVALFLVWRMPDLTMGSVCTALIDFFFIWSLAVCAAFDARWKLLPVECMAGATVLVAVGRSVVGVVPESIALGVLVGAGFFGVQYMISRGRWIGAGDVWLGGLLGAGLGWPVISAALFFSYLAGGLVAGGLLLTGQGQGKTRIPLAPFTFIGTLIVFFFSRQVTDFLLDISSLFG